MCVRLKTAYMYVCIHVVCIHFITKAPSQIELTPQSIHIPQQGWDFTYQNRYSQILVPESKTWTNDIKCQQNPINHKFMFHLIRYVPTTFTILASNRLTSILKPAGCSTTKYKFTFIQPNTTKNYLCTP